MKHSPSSIENNAPLIPPVLHQLRYDTLFNNDLIELHLI